MRIDVVVDFCDDCAGYAAFSIRRDLESGHLHAARRPVLAFPNFGFSLARDKAVFPLRELTGNVWMAKPDTRQQNF